MSGRGRGRGKKYTPPSGAALFLRRSLDECGLGVQALKSRADRGTLLSDITRPALFPPIGLHSSGDQRLLVLEQQQARQKEEEAMAALEAAADGGAAGATGTTGTGGGNGNNHELQAAVKSEGDLTSSSAAAAGGGGDGDAFTTKPLRIIARSAQTLALIGKSREMHHRLQNSVHYIRPTKDVPDVIRYSERERELSYDGGDGDGGDNDITNGNKHRGGNRSGSRHTPTTSDPTAVDASVVLSACLGGRKRTRLGMFVPDELAHGQRTNVRRGRSASAGGAVGGLGDALAAGRAVRLTELEEIERKRARAGSVGLANAAAAAAGRGRTTSVGNQADGDDDYYDGEEVEEDEGEDYVMNYYESEGDDGSDFGGEPTF